MNKEYKISDVLADENHEAYNATKEMLAKLESGEINMCGCIGAMYGEPYCPCQMKQRGLTHVMEDNPVRRAAEERDARQHAEFIAKGGWAKLFGKGE